MNIGVLIFAGMDQIDFTGPFEVFSRIPGAKIHVIAKARTPIRDYHGLILTPDAALAEAPRLDLLHVPGGPGQQDLMDDEPVLSFIRRQFDSGGYIFSVCTGALLCGAAGILRGRRATTHWAAFDLLPFFGAIPVDSRVVVDGELISAAGVTAGIDGALTLVSLLCGDELAQRIQLSMEYAPAPPFQAGSPRTAPPEVFESVTEEFRELTESRRITAQRVAARLGMKKAGPCEPAS